MFARKIGKIFLAASLSLGLVACAQQESKEEPKETIKEEVKVLAPAGAPSLALLGAYNMDKVTIDTVEGADVLTAELAKKDSDYDIIVAPTNLGAKLYEKAEAYQLASVLTWGNLYLVGSPDTDVNGANIAVFGENAVPGLVFRSLYDVDSMNVTYYGSVQEAQQALLTDQSQVALLAQPAAAATIAKAKEKQKELTVLQDLQKLWQEKHNSESNGYPQASLFIKKGEKKKVQYVLNDIKEYLKNVDEETVSKDIENIGADKLGLPNAAIASKTWKQQNIRFVSSKDAEKDIETFLELFNISCPEGLFVK